jgi:hypothetical protein
MKKSTSKLGAKGSAAKVAARAPLGGDVLAALEQQRHDVEELIERFDSAGGEPEPNAESDEDDA